MDLRPYENYHDFTRAKERTEERIKKHKMKMKKVKKINKEDLDKWDWSVALWANLIVGIGACTIATITKLSYELACIIILTAHIGIREWEHIKKEILKDNKEKRWL